ncbi:MAG: ATP-binding protein [Gemmataceae bacterium]|nr:ATP-binding protein [Gemmataceae bacterium]
MPRLIVVKGTDLGKQYEIEGECSAIGRDSTNAIRLFDTEASRRHAEFRRNPDGSYRLVDLGSANGTYVNTRLIRECDLQYGDHLQIGQTILVYTASVRPLDEPTQIADQIRMIGRHEDSPSAIIKTIGEAEAARILARPGEAASEWLRTRLANLSVMYETVQAVSHILEIDPLLERIMELIFRSIEADRGCIMLRRAESQDFEPKAVRFREGLNPHERIEISRTIMDYVLRERQGVLVSDAARDERFSSGQSIVRFGIREAICVPMKGRHETLGVLYLDTRTTPREMIDQDKVTGKFTEDHLTLAIAIAHQAALAVEETRYYQALVQAERLAAVGQTIAALSHHIKNILQGLRSGSELLKLGIAEKNEDLIAKGWRVLDKNQNKVYDLVLDMLSYSKEREPAIEPTDLNRVVLDVVELCRPRAEEQAVKLEAVSDPTLPQVPADPEGVHRALLNVVGNALDAVSDRPDGEVRILVRRDPSQEWACVEVVDNGPGIPAESLEEIFRPFVSTKGARGTGLGLPVSRKIMREHGGDIHVESQPGRGSRFVLCLPLRSPLSIDVGTSHELPVLAPEPS